MNTMNFSQDETAFLKKLVGDKLAAFEKEASTVVADMSFPFLKSEELYEEFEVPHEDETKDD